MAHTKLTLTRDERDAIAARAKCTTGQAKKPPNRQRRPIRLCPPPSRKTVDGGKTPIRNWQPRPQGKS